MINLTNEIQSARKENNKIALEAYKSIKQKQQEVETSKKFKGMTDKIQFDLIRKEIKERQETALAFSQARGPEYHETILNYHIATFLETLLPKSEYISRKDTISLIESIMDELNINSIKEIGKVMGKLKQSGKEINMNLASELVKEILQ